MINDMKFDFRAVIYDRSDDNEPYECEFEASCFASALAMVAQMLPHIEKGDGLSFLTISSNVVDLNYQINRTQVKGDDIVTSVYSFSRDLTLSEIPPMQ